MNELKIVVLNGYSRSGKDTFVKIVSKQFNCINHSSIDKVKYIAKQMGWDGIKNEKNRQMLSELKQFYVKWFDGPYKDIIKLINDTIQKNIQYPFDKIYFIFIHIREPEEIQRIKNYCENNKLLKFYSIFVQCDESEKNHKSDSMVENFDYDFICENNSTLQIFEKNINTILSKIT